MIDQTIINNNHKKSWLKPTIYIPILGIIVTISLYALFILIYWEKFMNTPLPYLQGDEFPSAFWGQFGDFIGGMLNPLFAMLTFGGLLYTIVVQREELDVQRKELRISGDALTESKNIAGEQLKHIQNETKKSDIRNILSIMDSEIQSIFEDKTDYHVSEGFHHLLKSICQSIARGEVIDYNEGPKGKAKRIFDILITMDGALSDYFELTGDAWTTTYYAGKYKLYADMLAEYNLINFDEGSWFRKI